MDYEKKYKEALEWARKVIQGEVGFVLDEVLEKFPELAESEDERIRKALYLFVEAYGAHSQYATQEDILAWIEKQGKQKTVDEIAKEVCKNKESAMAFLKSAGIINEKGELAEQYRQSEQNTTNKVEPKFKVGDFLVGDYCIGRVVELTDDAYLLDTEQGIPFSCEHNVHLWTIQDAKDGDVLYMDNGLSTCTFIYKSINNVIIQKYASYNKFGFEGTTYLVLNDGYVCPATKEQRDLLFQKMKEAGYKWDTEKKELRKIVVPIFHIGDRVRYKGHKCDGVITEITNTDYICGDAKLPISTQDKLELIEQNLAWSEEDEVALCDALWCCKQAASIAKDENDMGNVWYAEHWLKSLKDRYAWKPSDVQMEVLLGEANAWTKGCPKQKILESLYNDLKKLKG